MIRDLILASCVLVCLGLTFRFSFAGVLTWTWIALMQPHTEVYGPISSALRINLLVAIITILAWLVSKERKLPPSDGVIVAIFLFLIWMTFNQLFAVNPDAAWPLWDRNWRIIALGLLIGATATNKIRIHALIWVLVASFLYYGAKSGLLTIMAGGAKKLMGPSEGMYADNNQFAVALLMTLPLINYLRVQSANRYIRMGLIAGFALTFIAVLGSYSRGAFVGLSALGLVWWFRSRNKALYVIVAAIIAVPAFLFMPQTYFNRMSTIDHAQDDGSFQGRVDAWKVAFDYARDHFPVGAGFDGPQQPKIFNHYLPGHDFHAAHSIFFQVLGDLGFMGLAIYLVILFLVFRYCSRIRRAARLRPELAWAHDLATAIQLSMVGFCVGGSALSLAYSDFLFIWAGLLPQLYLLVRQVEPQMRWRGFSVISPVSTPGMAIATRRDAPETGGIAGT
jgi:putative inorganic carbon (hco3(-)) transporter